MIQILTLSKFKTNIAYIQTTLLTATFSSFNCLTKLWLSNWNCALKYTCLHYQHQLPLWDLIGTLKLESKPTFCALRRTSTAVALIQPTHVARNVAQNTKQYSRPCNNNIHNPTQYIHSGCESSVNPQVLGSGSCL